MGTSRFGLTVADKESKCIPHKFPRSHWLKTTGQCVKEGYLSATISDKIRRDFEIFYCFAIISIHGTKTKFLISKISFTKRIQTIYLSIS